MSRGQCCGDRRKSQLETKYVVNAEKRTIVCLLTDTDWDKTFTGIAKCNPDDVFDETVGKRVANYRAHMEFHKFHFDMEVKDLDRLAHRHDELYGRIVSRQRKFANLKQQLANTLDE
jgi:hypothetical protein